GMGVAGDWLCFPLFSPVKPASAEWLRSPSLPSVKLRTPNFGRSGRGGADAGFERAPDFKQGIEVGLLGRAGDHVIELVAFALFGFGRDHAALDFLRTFAATRKALAQFGDRHVDVNRAEMT